jgi:hypothetical protein
MNKKIIVLLIVVLIIPIVFYIANANQQVSEEPAGFDVEEENSVTDSDGITTEVSIEENEETERKEEVDKKEEIKDSSEENINNDNNREGDISESVEETSDEGNPGNNDSEEEQEELYKEEKLTGDETTENTSEEEGISYSSETGIKIDGEIDFDMSLQEEISNEDKIEALLYAAKLDIPYLLGLMKDGITAEDKKLVSEHLRERLTEEEYNKTKNLRVKYLYLLE